jgi:uncharacterized protein YjbI with pentapeptide repeats
MDADTQELQGLIFSTDALQWNIMMAKMLGVPLPALYKYTGVVEETTSLLGPHRLTYSPDWFKKLNEIPSEPFGDYLKKKSPEGQKASIATPSAILEGKIFVGIDFSNSCFTDGFFSQCIFFNCTLNNVDFSGSYIGGCTFRNCNLTHTKFENTEMWKTNFISSNFFKANLNQARLTECLLMTIIRQSECRDIKFLHSALDKCIVMNVDFSNTEFICTSIVSSEVSSTNMSHTNFHASIVNGCDFSGSEFVGLKLRHNTIVNCIFSDPTLKEVVEYANISKASRHHQENTANGEIEHEMQEFARKQMEKLLASGLIKLPQNPDEPDVFSNYGNEDIK